MKEILEKIEKMVEENEELKKEIEELRKELRKEKLRNNKETKLKVVVKSYKPYEERIPIGSTGLSCYDRNVYNAIKKIGVRYIQNLSVLTREEIKNLPYIGEVHTAKLEKSMSIFGVTFKEEDKK